MLTFIGLFLLAVSMNEYIDPRSRLAGWAGVTALMAAAGAGPRRSRDLRAYYQMRLFRHHPRGARGRRHHASTSSATRSTGSPASRARGKTSLIKTIAGAIRPPLNVVGGSVSFNFLDRDRSLRARRRRRSPAIRWKHLSYIMQGSMSVLNPVRRVRQHLRRFRLPPHRPADAGVPRARSRRIWRGCTCSRRCCDAYPHELSGGMRQRVAIALATICRPEFIIADEPTTALDVVVQKDVLAMMREIQREMGSSMLFVTHDMAVHANMTDRLGHHVCRPAGRGGADAATSSRGRCIPTPRT